MPDNFLVTTASEGLKPLGTPHQRSFELVTSAVRARLSDRHAAIFSEPVATEYGDKIDWYATTDAPARVRPVADLDEADRDALLSELDHLKDDIRRDAQSLAESKNPDDQRLAEALLNALEVPGPDCVFAVVSGSDTPLPVLVNWARTSDRQEAVRGVLSGSGYPCRSQSKARGGGRRSVGRCSPDPRRDGAAGQRQGARAPTCSGFGLFG